LRTERSNPETFRGGTLAGVRFTIGDDKTGGEFTPDYVSAIDRDLPIEPDYRLVPSAGHFIFFAPCTPDLAKKRTDICTDRPGFDRGAFRTEFNAAALAFFRKHLARTDQPLMSLLSHTN
jgi:predicted dienelactone hydrolase